MKRLSNDYTTGQSRTGTMTIVGQTFTVNQSNSQTRRAFDFDGDGKTNIAVYRDGIWYVLQSANGFAGVSFGVAEDLPVPADSDGDGKTDRAVYRNGIWYLLRWQQGFSGVQFGIATDKPASGAFVP